MDDLCLVSPREAAWRVYAIEPDVASAKGLTCSVEKCFVFLRLTFRVQ